MAKSQVQKNRETKVRNEALGITRFSTWLPEHLREEWLKKAERARIKHLKELGK